MRQKILLLSLCLAFVGNWALGQTTYYSKSTATDFNSASSWGTATDGTGTSPASVSNADNFVIGNGATMTLSASAVVRALYIGSFTGFTPATAAGTLTISGSNTLTVSRATGNNATMGISTSGTLNISGSSILINGNFSMTGGAFNQTGGTITLDGNDANTAASSVASGTHLFSISGGTPSCSAGTITIVDPPVNTYSVQTTRSVVMSLPASNTYFTGTHTFVFGDGVSTTPGNTDGFVLETYASSRAPIQNLTINAGNASGRWGSTSMNSSTAYGTHIKGTLTINTGSEFRVNPNSTSANEWLVGSIVNNGTLTSSRSSSPPVLNIGAHASLSGYAPTTASSISGSGIFRNLATSATAHYAGLVLNNINGISFAAGTLALGSYTGNLSGTLNFTAGVVTTNGQTFTVGTGTGTLGSVSYTAGGFSSGSTMGRWFAAGTAGSTISASTVPSSSGSGAYPFANGSNSRFFYVSRPATTGATGGVINVAYDEGSGGLSTLGTPVSDAGPTYTIDRQSMANWTVSTSGGFAAGTGTFTYAASNQNAFVPTSNAVRLMKATTVVGTYQAGTTLPHAQRTAISAADFAGTFYQGINSADVAGPCTTPGAQPTSQIVSAPSAAAISGTFTAATGAPTNYLVVIATNGAVPTAPVDGTNYTAGSSALGTNTSVLSSGTAATFSASSLTSNTSYTFYIYSINTGTCAGGPKYNATSPLSFTVVTCPAAATGLNATALSTTGATLNWTASVAGGAANTIGYTVDVSTNSTFTAPITGSPFTATGVSQSIFGLSPSTTYYYRVGAVGSCTTYTSASNFTTLCNPISTLPWTENFDAMTTIGANILPSCWAQSGGLSGYPFTSSNAASNTYNDPFSTPNYVAIYYPTTAGFMWTPGFTLTNGVSYDFSFKWAGDGYSGWVGDALVNSSQLATGATTLGNFVASSTTTTSAYTDVKYTFTPTATGTYYFGVKSFSATTAPYWMGFDNFKVELTPSCTSPTALIASAVTATTATLGWTASASSPLSYDIYYGTNPLAVPTTATPATTTSTTTSVAVSSLTPNTAYQFYVRSNCGIVKSAWSSVGSFTTQCNTISTFPWTENFDALTTLGANILPSCWAQNSGGSAFTSANAASNSYNDPLSAPNYVTVYYPTTPSYLWTPGFTLTNGTSYDFTFKWVGDTYDGWVGDAIVNTAQSSTGVTSLGQFVTSTVVTSGSTYTTVTYSFTPTSTGTYYFGVKSQAVTFAPYYMGFDDFKVDLTPVCTTPAPGATITSASSACLGSSITLSLQNPTPGAIVSYQWYASTNGGVTYSAITGANSATYIASPAVVTSYYATVTCSLGPSTASSTPVSVGVTNCSFDAVRTTGITYNSIAVTGSSVTSWLALTPTNTDDNVSSAQSIGFAFPYKGGTYTQFKVSTNGWITLDMTQTGSVLTNGFTSSTKLFLAPFWEDLVTQGSPGTAAALNSSIKYQTIGNAPNRKLIVEWVGFERYGNAGPNLNFQVVLNETSGVVEYRYGAFEGFNGTINSTYSYTVGLSSIAGTGTSIIDQEQQQVENTNYFSANAANSLTIPAECYSSLIFVPANYTGPTSYTTPVPVNDDPTGAIAIPVNALPCTSLCGTYYTSKGATASAQTSLCSTTTDDDVWFSFTAPPSGTAQIKVLGGGGYNPVVSLADNTYTDLTGFSCVNATGNGLTETLNVTTLNPSATYYLRISHNGSGSGTDGTFSICLNDVTPPPSNDDSCGAINLVANTACVTTSGSTVTATASNNPVSCNTPDDDVWYQFTASSASHLITLQSGTGFNAAMQIYSAASGTCTGGLTSLTCINSTSTGGVETYSGPTGGFSVGTTYFIRVYHAASGAGSGNFTICVTSPVPNCVATPTAPSNASTICAGNGTTLSWPSVATATGYDIYLDPSPGPASSLVSSNQSGTSYTTPAPLTAGSYSWRVIPRNANGAPGACSDFNFTIISSPTATLSPAGPMTLCTGQSQLLTATTNATSPSYQFRNNGTSIGGATTTTYLASATGSYTVTVTDPATACSFTSAPVAITVQAPPAIVVTPSASSLGCGSSVMLSAITTASVPSYSSIQLEEFNSGSLGSYTQSTGSTHTDGAWLNYPNGYIYSALSVTFNTSDASDYVMVNSDSIGSGKIQRLYITSAPFSTAGYPEVKVAIEDYYRNWTSGDSAILMQASTDGTTWATFADIKALGTHGSPTAFAKDTFSLPNAYVNKPSVYIRGLYATTFGYYWAINRIEVIGTNTATATTTSWTPTDDLYTNASATIPYTGGSASTVYAKPSTDIKVVALYNNGLCTGVDTATVSVTGSPSSLAGASGASESDMGSAFNSTISFRYSDCDLIATATPSGAAPLAGYVSAKVTEDASVQSYLSLPYATRHYDIEPQANAANATAIVKLFFTQAEMTAYNTYLTSNSLTSAVLPMPSSSIDVAGMANIRVRQYHGTGTAPANYTGTAQTITPTSVTWNVTNSWWEVTFPVSGFSGFYLTTGRFPTIAVKAYLQGALNSGTTMDNYYQDYFATGSGLMPTTNPYGVPGGTYSQINASTGPAGAIVDWVKVEVRENANPSNILQTRALLLKTNGSIVDSTGGVPYFNPQSASVVIAVWHRNHLAVMSNSITAPSQDQAKTYDFSTSLSQASNPYGDPQQMVQKNGVWCMWAGDVNNPQDLFIDNSDFLISRNIYLLAPYDVYNVTDLNLDGFVDNTDFLLERLSYQSGLYSTLSNY